MSNGSQQKLMNGDHSRTKRIVILANHDHAEAMRVAAGLTIFGHQIKLVFIDRVVEESAENIEQAELLELSEIEPVSLVADPNIDRIDDNQLAALLLDCQHVVSI
jgi:hypothetical protein